MLTLALPTPIYLGLAPTDMRKSFDALAALVRDELKGDLFSGSLFVFRSKRRDRIKLLDWDADGFMLWMKRLERGTYEFPRTQADLDVMSLSSSSTDLALILSGIDRNSAKRRPRYRRPDPNGA
jgi:transposase